MGSMAHTILFLRGIGRSSDTALGWLNTFSPDTPPLSLHASGRHASL